MKKQRQHIVLQLDGVFVWLEKLSQVVAETGKTGKANETKRHRMNGTKYKPSVKAAILVKSDT